MRQFENLKITGVQKATSHRLQAKSYLAGDTRLAACGLQLATSQFPIIQVFKLLQHQ